MFKFGIVGAGIIAKAHLEGINKHSECELVAVADIVKEKAEEIAANTDAAVFTDYHDMCNIDLDVVIINLPHYLHCEATCFFLKNGVNVFVEKPMAMNVEECDEMIKTANENNVLLAIGHVQQYTKAHRYLKNIIKTQELGRLLRITETRNIDYFGNRPAWFLDKKLSGGGIVMNYGAHTLDKVLYLTDSEISEVCSVVSNNINNANIEEGAQILVKLKNGVSASFSYTGSKVPYIYEMYCYFEKGIIKVTHSVNLFVYDNGDWKQIIEPDTKMHDEAIVELVKALKGEASEVTTPLHGRAVIDGVTRIYNSSF